MRRHANVRKTPHCALFQQPPCVTASFSIPATFPAPAQAAACRDSAAPATQFRLVLRGFPQTISPPWTLCTWVGIRQGSPTSLLFLCRMITRTVMDSVVTMPGFALRGRTRTTTGITSQALITDVLPWELVRYLGE